MQGISRLRCLLSDVTQELVLPLPPLGEGRDGGLGL